jgi:hypothetical protein
MVVHTFELSSVSISLVFQGGKHQGATINDTHSPFLYLVHPVSDFINQLDSPPV